MISIEQSAAALKGAAESSESASDGHVIDAILRRTAWEKAHRQHAMHQFLTRHAVLEHRADLTKMLRDIPRIRASVTVHDLEQYSPKWRHLVPPSPMVRAEIANHLAAVYAFTRDQLPHTRAALGLDEPEVQKAYTELFHRPLDSIYSTRLSFAHRVRGGAASLASRLEHLPPFWMAFALTLPVGPGLLALPIAMAGIGPIPGIILLLLFGIINVITVAALAEALTRSSDLRYSRTFFLGHLVEEYLGRAGSLIFSLIFVVDLILVLLIFYLGVAGTLADATRLPAPLWAALLFAVGLYFLSRKSLNTTLAFAIIVGIVNVSLILLLTLIAFSHLNAANLAYVNVPFLNGSPFDPATVRLVIGVTLAAYFSHMLVGNYGKLVLEHDPSGRALMRGSVAAIGFTTLLSILWVLAMNGALDPAVLRNESGTVLVPLSAAVGAGVGALGSIFVIIGLGMASIHISLGLYFTMREWLARPALRGLASRPLLETILTYSPVVAIFMVAEWMLVTGTGSFSELFGFVGVIALSLLSAIFPMLLLLAARRKGELVPSGGIFPFLDHPVLIGGIYICFLAAIFVHGTILWSDPFERAGAVVVGILVLIATWAMVRHKTFAPRLVLELHEHLAPHPEGTNPSQAGAETIAEFGVALSGRRGQAGVSLVYPDAVETREASSGGVPDLPHLLSAEFRIAAKRVHDLKVSARRTNDQGDLEGLPLQISVRGNGETRRVNLHETAGQAVLRLEGPQADLLVTLTKDPPLL